MTTVAAHQHAHGPGHPPVAPEDDAASEDDFKDLKDVEPDELQKYAPIGFRFMRGSVFPDLKGHIIPQSMSSGSHSAKRMYFDEADIPLSEASSDKQEPTTGKRKRDDDEAFEENTADEQKTNEAPDTEESQYQSGFWTSPCGRVVGVDWDGCAQCMCDICLGYGPLAAALHENDESAAHSQEGAAEEA